MPGRTPVDCTRAAALERGSRKTPSVRGSLRTKPRRRSSRGKTICAACLVPRAARTWSLSGRCGIVGGRPCPGECGPPCMIGARHSVLGNGRGRWPGLAANRRRAAGRSLGISTSSDHPGRCGALDHLRHSHWALTCLLATAVIALPPSPAWSQAQPGGSSRPADEPRRTSDRPPPSYFVILNAPADFDALLQKIRQPDLEVRPIATGGDGRGRRRSTGRPGRPRRMGRRIGEGPRAGARRQRDPQGRADDRHRRGRPDLGADPAG